MCLAHCNPKDWGPQAFLPMGFPRQEYWSGSPFLSYGLVLTQGSDPCFLHWQVNSLLLSLQGIPLWSGLPFPPTGGLPDSGIKSSSLASPALAGGFFTTEPPVKPLIHDIICEIYMMLCMLSHFSSVRLCATHGQQPTRLFCPQNSPGKNTGVTCHFLLPIYKILYM